MKAVHFVFLLVLYPIVHAHAEILEPARGEAAVHEIMPMLEDTAPIMIEDNAAKQIFDDMTNVPEDENGIKRGKAIQCIRFQEVHYSCNTYLDAKGGLKLLRPVSQAKRK